MEAQKAAAILGAAVLLPVLFGFCGSPVRAETGNPAGRIDAGTTLFSADTEAAARGILGRRTPLSRAKVGALVLYSCPNGYALIDPADGRVVEYALSCPGKEPVFVRSAPDSESTPEETTPTE